MSTHETLPAFEANRRAPAQTASGHDTQPFTLPLWDMMPEPPTPPTTQPLTSPSIPPTESVPQAHQSVHSFETIPASEGPMGMILETMPFDPVWQDHDPSPADAPPVSPTDSTTSPTASTPDATSLPIQSPTVPHDAHSFGLPLSPSPHAPTDVPDTKRSSKGKKATPLGDKGHVRHPLSDPDCVPLVAPLDDPPPPIPDVPTVHDSFLSPSDQAPDTAPLSRPLMLEPDDGAGVHPVDENVLDGLPVVAPPTASQGVDGCWAAVTSLLDLLQSLKTDRDEWDRQVPSWKARVAAHITTSEGVFRELDQGFERLWGAYTRLSHDQQRPIAHSLHAMAKESGLIDSTINRHIMAQPFGYPGDFQAIDYLYDYADAWVGTTSYELLLNDYTTSIPIAYSTCLRKTTLANIIRDHLRDTPHAHVVSVGSGRAREWEELLRDGHITRPLMITFVDMDTRALTAISEWVETLSDAQRSLVSIRTVHQDIRRIIRDPLSFSHAPTLVYAMGLFDYLPDRLARPLIRHLSGTLSHSGVLWISNVNRQHESHRAYYELMGGWKLIFRDPTDLLAWCTDLTLSGQIIDPPDPLNTHSYLRITC